MCVCVCVRSLNRGGTSRAREFIIVHGLLIAGRLDEDQDVILVDVSSRAPFWGEWRSILSGNLRSKGLNFNLCCNYISRQLIKKYIDVEINNSL